VQEIPHWGIFNPLRITIIRTHNKKINLTGTAIGEFDFLVLAIRFLKILKYSAPYVPAGYFSVRRQ